MAPRLQAFLVADAVYQDRETGKHVIAGTFVRLFVPRVPGELGRGISTYAALLGVNGSLQLAMQFETGAGDVLIKSSPMTLTCNDPEVLVEFTLTVPSLPLPRLGSYRIVLLLDGQRFASHSIEVALAQ